MCAVAQIVVLSELPLADDRTPIITGGVVGRRDRRDRLGEDGDGEHDGDGDGDEQQQRQSSPTSSASTRVRSPSRPTATA